MKKKIVFLFLCFSISMLFAQINHEEYQEVSVEELNSNSKKYNGKKVVIKNTTEIGIDPIDAENFVNACVMDDTGPMIVRLNIMLSLKFANKTDKSTKTDYYGIFYVKNEYSNYIIADDVVYGSEKEKSIQL